MFNKSSIAALVLTLALGAVSTGAVAAEAAKAAPAKAPADMSGKAAIDTDGNGSVSKAEFMAYQEKRFAEMDANKDGNITDEEHKASVQQFIAKRKEIRASQAPAAAPAAKVPAAAEGK